MPKYERDISTMSLKEIEALEKADRYCPPDVIAALERYVEYGASPGGFLRAVLENDLHAAFGFADLNNRRHVFGIVCYIYTELPSCCWGSPANVASWIARKLDERKQKA